MSELLSAPHLHPSEIAVYCVSGTKMALGSSDKDVLLIT